MQLKFLAAAIAATTALGACTTRPVVVETPAPQTVIVPMAVPPPSPPIPPPPPSSISLHDRVHDALQAGMGAAASGIEVRADGSAVYLTGQVATSADHTRAHAIAHDVPGVTQVDHSGLMVR